MYEARTGCPWGAPVTSVRVCVWTYLGYERAASAVTDRICVCADRHGVQRACAGRGKTPAEHVLHLDHHVEPRRLWPRFVRIGAVNVFALFI